MNPPSVSSILLRGASKTSQKVCHTRPKCKSLDNFFKSMVPSKTDLKRVQKVDDPMVCDTPPSNTSPVQEHSHKEISHCTDQERTTNTMLTFPQIDVCQAKVAQQNFSSPATTLTVAPNHKQSVKKCTAITPSVSSILLQKSKKRCSTVFPIERCTIPSLFDKTHMTAGDFDSSSVTPTVSTSIVQGRSDKHHSDNIGVTLDSDSSMDISVECSDDESMFEMDYFVDSHDDLSQSDTEDMMLDCQERSNEKLMTADNDKSRVDPNLSSNQVEEKERSFKLPFPNFSSAWYAKEQKMYTTCVYNTARDAVRRSQPPERNSANVLVCMRRSQVWGTLESNIEILEQKINNSSLAAKSTH